MNKTITLPDDTAKILRIIAALDGTNSKKYIENLVISHVRTKKIKLPK